MLYRDTQHAGLVHLLVHPFGDNVAKIEELLKNLKERYTIVIVTHNLAQAKRIADDVAFFQNGRRVETKDAETFWEKPECEETKEFLKG